MKISRSTLIVAVTALIAMSLAAGGCRTAAQKPANPTTPPNYTTPAPINNSPAPMAPAPTTADISKQAVAEALKVNGVKSATAFVSGKTIYIGLELAANQKNMTPATIEKSVMDQVKLMQPGYTVMVTSDKKAAAQIKAVSQGIAQGKPLSSFQQEINSINTKLKSK
ncbi:MAG TPA: YhcN/YlaJ family sporulation lipoprotein [Syntrophomonadaceae bacterium]|nr:YhcN/YlaJ family sporulation lipoprotein [Syntrophomonadaceae bacterium]